MATFALGGEDGLIRLLEVKNGELEFVKVLGEHDSTVMCSSNSGDLLATGSYDNTVRVWSVSQSKCLATLRDHSSSVRSVHFGSRNHQTLLCTGSDDESVHIWDVNSFPPTVVKKLERLGGCVFCVRFSQDSGLLAASSDDGNIRIWSAQEDFALVSVLEGSSPCFGGMSFTHIDSELALLTAHRDRHCRIWKMSSQPVLAGEVKASRKLIECVCTARDWFAIGSDDGVVSVWNVLSGEKIFHLEGHTKWVLAVAWCEINDKEMLLLSASADGTVRLWDMSNGACLSTITIEQNLKLHTLQLIQ